MIRPFTCVCVLAFIGSGLYLYQTKHRAQMLDRDIARTIKTTETVRERIGVLRGEWALLNEPERLAELSQQHLGLRTLAPTQFVALADLAARMPAPLPPGSIATPIEEPDPAPVALRTTTPIQVAQAPAPTPQPAAKPAATPAPSQLAALPPAPAPRPPTKPVQPASAATPPAAKPALPTPAPVQQAAAPAPRFAAPVISAASAPMATQPTQNWIGESVARAARARAAPQAAAPYQSATVVQASAPMQAPPALQQPGYPGSALGGARTALPPPVPYGAR